MSYKQTYADYETLRTIAMGEPNDASETLEGIAFKMLRKPSAKEAEKHLCGLIRMYFERGGPQGDSLQDNPEAHEIFVRHGFIGDEDEESLNN